MPVTYIYIYQLCTDQFKILDFWKFGLFTVLYIYTYTLYILATILVPIALGAYQGISTKPGHLMKLIIK